MERVNLMIKVIIFMVLIPVFVINAEVKKKTITNELEKLESQKLPEKGPVIDIFLKPDLTVAISGCPTSLDPGDVLPSSMKVEIGYESPKKVGAVNVGYDIVLQNSPTCKYPVTYTDPSEKDRILLEAGRGNVVLKTGQKKNVLRNTLDWQRGRVPKWLTSGTYYLCVYIDTFNKVDESNEKNNCTCCEIEIAPYVKHKKSFYK